MHAGKTVLKLLWYEYYDLNNAFLIAGLFVWYHTQQHHCMPINVNPIKFSKIARFTKQYEVSLLPQFLCFCFTIKAKWLYLSNAPRIYIFLLHCTYYFYSFSFVFYLFFLRFFSLLDFSFIFVSHQFYHKFINIHDYTSI